MELNSLEFDRALPLRGRPERVLQLAQAILGASGFRLARKGREFVDFAGDRKGGAENPLPAVASRLHVEARPGEVRLRASLDGLRTMRNLLLLLPVGLGILFIALFMLLFRQTGMQEMVFVALAPVVPWLVLMPLLMGWIRRRTERALDTLLANLVKVADEEREGASGG